MSAAKPVFGGRTSQRREITFRVGQLRRKQSLPGKIREIGRVLKPGGIAIVTVPAFMFLWGLQDEISHRFRRYTKKELLVKIQAAGFSIERVGYFNFFLFPLIYLVRQAAKIMPLRRRSDFDINNKLVNYVLKNIFLSEIWLLKIISYPFGVSLLIVAKKK